MNQPRQPFRINVGFLINQPIGYSREFPFSFDHFQFKDEEIVENLSGSINLIRTQSGIQSEIEATAVVDAQCVRCLKPFKQALQTTFHELFTYAREPLSEDEESIPEDGYLDFEQSIKDYLFLEVPIKPLCIPECRGLCVVCGHNLNESPCDHVVQKNG